MRSKGYANVHRIKIVNPNINSQRDKKVEIIFRYNILNRCWFDVEKGIVTNS